MRYQKSCGICCFFLALSALVAPVPLFAQIPENSIEQPRRLAFATEQIPKRITIKRETILEFSGTLPARSLSAQIEIRKGRIALVRERVNGDWKLSWNTAKETGLVYSIFVVLVEPNGRETRLAATVVTLYDDAPVRLTQPRPQAEVTDTVELQATAMEGIEVEKYQVFLDGEETPLILNTQGKGSLSLVGRTPGIHQIKLRIRLGSGAGELFTESVPVVQKALVRLKVPDAGTTLDLRANAPMPQFPLGILSEPGIEPQAVTFLLDDKPVGRSDKAPFDGGTIDGNGLYAGSYRLGCEVTARDGKHHRSPDITLVVVRDAKGEYAKYWAQIEKCITTFEEPAKGVLDQEAEYPSIIARLNTDKMDLRAEAAAAAQSIARGYQGVDQRIYEALARIPIPLGVAREHHPVIRKALAQFAAFYTCRREGWSAEVRRIGMMDWAGDHWVYNTGRLLSLGNAKSKSQWDTEAEQNRVGALNILAKLADKL